MSEESREANVDLGEAVDEDASPTTKNGANFAVKVAEGDECADEDGASDGDIADTSMHDADAVDEDMGVISTSQSGSVKLCVPQRLTWNSKVPKLDPHLIGDPRMPRE